ncbi:AAA family ATPase [Pseudomonas taiwanensis]|uniref:AAA family ATPase n=1 Tax=Pseudomonas taiwanensis TaxID=470150 RepID=UPI0016477228|nr:ATP-binding protein [Pseudomonas taiwanensis]MBC3493381.1 ATP-binding protein [Pseudomonas taiwanensis]
MHIKEIGIYNVYKDKETSTLNFNAPVTILTGYNGCGKTTALGIIHSTLSLIAGQEYSFSKTNWACEITFADNAKILHAKISRPVKPNFKPLAIKPTKSDSLSISLNNYYEKISSDTIDNTKQSDTIVQKEGQGRPSLSTNIINIVRNSTKDEIKLSSTLYCDELFFSKEQEYESQKLQELDIFSENKNLDKTLLLLQKEFASRIPGDFASNRLMKEWKELIELLDSLPIKDKNHITQRLESLKTLNREKSETDILLDEANIFFKSTHRELIINERKQLALKTKRGEVQWYDFSKGEKTLICLLLAAHLTKQKEKVFLLDEPDLSLHLTWQKQLLPSLQRLAPNAQFIVATHSPALVGRCKNEKIVNLAQLAKA